MTFDVALLPGRAQELKEAGVNAAYRELTRFGAGGGSSYQMLKIAEDCMEGVEDIYDGFTHMPAPEDFAGVIDNLRHAMASIATSGTTQDAATGVSSLGAHSQNLTLVGSSSYLIGDWTGDAAYEFHKNYGEKFVPTASSQYAAMASLASAINAEAAVWQGMRDDLDKLSSRAIELMKKAGNKGGAEWVAALTIAAAVVAIPVTGGASAIAGPAIAAGLTVTATGIGLSSAGAGQTDELGLDAGSSDAVIESLQEALGKLKTHAVEQEAKISTAMNKASGVIDGDWTAFCLPRPALADAPDHPVNDPDYGGVNV